MGATVINVTFSSHLARRHRNSNPMEKHLLTEIQGRRHANCHGNDQHDPARIRAIDLSPQWPIAELTNTGSVQNTLRYDPLITRRNASNRSHTLTSN
uniref:Uncharacterized protein n=1 Tax=Mesocestoides corti TaxID=53468 RepID=A0A5K3FGW0_MESCO